MYSPLLMAQMFGLNRRVMAAVIAGVLEIYKCVRRQNPCLESCFVGLNILAVDQERGLAQLLSWNWEHDRTVLFIAVLFFVCLAAFDSILEVVPSCFPPNSRTGPIFAHSTFVS